MADVLIDYNKLQDAISNIDSEAKKLRELFDKQNNNFKLLEDNKIWYGTSNQNCLAKYAEVSGKYEGIISDLEKYKQFLYNLGESYKSINIEAERKIASNMQ